MLMLEIERVGEQTAKLQRRMLEFSPGSNGEFPLKSLRGRDQVEWKGEARFTADSMSLIENRSALELKVQNLPPTDIAWAGLECLQVFSGLQKGSRVLVARMKPGVHLLTGLMDPANLTAVPLIDGGKIPLDPLFVGEGKDRSLLVSNLTQDANCELRGEVVLPDLTLTKYRETDAVTLVEIFLNQDKKRTAWSGRMSAQNRRLEIRVTIPKGTTHLSLSNVDGNNAKGCKMPVWNVMRLSPAP
ncbi:MAG: hypothetical protein HEQ23_07025 [Tepidisphaera sp.]